MGSPSKSSVDGDEGDKRRRVTGKQRKEALFGRSRSVNSSETLDASQDHGIAGDSLPSSRRDASGARLLGKAMPRAESGARDPKIMPGSSEESSGLSPGRALPGVTLARGLVPRKGSLSRSLMTPQRWARCRRGLSKCP